MEPLIDQLIRTSFPHPVAAAWHRVSLATSSADRTKRLLVCVEVLVRVQCAILLPDYLRGPADDAVEKTIERLDRPALGHWVQLLRSLVRALDGRTPPPFVPEAISWYFSKGRPSDAAKRLDALVEIRNDEAHGRALSVPEQDDRAIELVADLRAVLSDLSFLARYRPFRVLTSTLSRSGGFSGQVQFLTGAAPQPEPVRATWPSRLFEESVYLTNPSGDEVLEISPFVGVYPDAGAKEDRVFVVAGTLKGKKLVLKNDGTGATETVLLPSDDGDIPLDAWLAARANHHPWQSNAGASENFRALQRSAIGELLAGRFEVREELGQGGMATVFRVWDQWDEAEFAVKVLHRQLADDPNFKERFRREARTMKRLRHPHVIPVEEAGQLEDGRLFLKLPLLLGGTLQDRVKAGASPPEVVRKWAVQLASALAYLHAHGVVHRDIKPSNFLLDQDGNAFLTDFGIAVQGDDIRLTRALEQMGSVAYMSPEQRRGGEAGPPSDVYSMGIALHELLTGREGDPSPGRGLDGLLGELVRAMCAEDPADRITASAALDRLNPTIVPAPPPEPEVAPEPAPAADLSSVAFTGIAAGSFAMSPDRKVTLTRPFLSSGPLSGADWEALSGGPAKPGPIRGVSWYDAVQFCNRASERHGLAPAYRFGELHPRKAYSIDDIGRMLRDLMPEKRRAAILKHFGTEALTVLQFAPERLTEIAGIGEKTAAEYGRKWDRSKYFVRDVTWDRSAPGFRLPTEAEWVHAVHDPELPLPEWVWCADPAPSWITGASPLAAGEFVDPSTDEGPRRIVRGPTSRQAMLPESLDLPVGFRVVRWG